MGSRFHIVALIAAFTSNGTFPIENIFHMLQMLYLGYQADKSQSQVTSMCFNHQGDLLLAGYGDGHIIFWDVQKAQVVKLISGEHTSPVVHTLFLGQDSQATRNFKVVTGDCKGRVLLHVISVVPMFYRFTIETKVGKKSFPL